MIDVKRISSDRAASRLREALRQLAEKREAAYRVHDLEDRSELLGNAIDAFLRVAHGAVPPAE